MDGFVEFERDVENDIVIVTPHWNIATAADIEAWRQQWVRWFETHTPGRQVDCVIVLTDFHVATAVAAAWGAVRAEMVARYMRHSFRVDSNSKVSFYVNTSGAKFNVATHEAASVADAIAGILEARKPRASERLRASRS